MAKHLGTDKETEKLRRIAEKNGWKVTVTGGNHLKWAPPNGEPYFCGLTAGGYALPKLKNELKKRGLNI